MSITQSTSTHLLAQADLVLLVAELFRPPAAGAVQLESIDASAIDELLAAAGVDDDADLSSALHATLREQRTTPRPLWSAEYHRLFEGALLCPPNETAYVRRDKGAIIGDIVAFYRAFGMTPQTQIGEKPDHIVAQLEFVAVLLTMVASAEDAEQEQIAREAIVKFADAHLGDWVLLFADRLESVAALPLFQRSAALLKALWFALAGAHDLAPAAAGAGTLNEEPDSPYECGMAPDAVNPHLGEDHLVELHVKGVASPLIPSP